ncbi:hypothetical protein B0G81_6228 [Paraburkholderia sp. BL6665CI2N2]|uniref:hypothetical protein n=1 Tax=Paraburkholderia sp. BL6665CI2N2 TaxID=1938806 RepID=UPI0010D9C358|nr:hypothetical protein [Paraburkholderia sp. BL6665CI2N2]TDY25746.1 hypothetical protein B0G81_6228 [Paraburkholderia sp. BL6665CI2N2]
MREGGIRHRVSPPARGAQGKRNPEDLPAGSADREDATNEFPRDLLRAMDDEPYGSG